MGRSKLKKRLRRQLETESTDESKYKVPIKNLPEKFVWMHVSSLEFFIDFFSFYSFEICYLIGEEWHQDQECPRVRAEGISQLQSQYCLDRDRTGHRESHFLCGALQKTARRSSSDYEIMLYQVSLPRSRIFSGRNVVLVKSILIKSN